MHVKNKNFRMDIDVAFDFDSYLARGVSSKISQSFFLPF